MALALAALITGWAPGYLKFVGAREAGVVVVASLFERRAAGVYHNTAPVLDADGRLLGVYRKMQVGAFLTYMAQLKGQGGDLAARVRHGLERVGLGGTEKKRCEELSKGMQQKVQFIATLLHDPDLHKRGIMQTIEHPVRGPVIVAGWPLRMSDTKVALKCAPILGADCEAIYGEWLGCSPDEVRDMRQGKVI